MSYRRNKKGQFAKGNKKPKAQGKPKGKAKSKYQKPSKLSHAYVAGPGPLFFVESFGLLGLTAVVLRADDGRFPAAECEDAPLCNMVAEENDTYDLDVCPFAWMSRRKSFLCCSFVSL